LDAQFQFIVALLARSRRKGIKRTLFHQIDQAHVAVAGRYFGGKAEHGAEQARTVAVVHQRRVGSVNPSDERAEIIAADHQPTKTEVISRELDRSVGRVKVQETTKFLFRVVRRRTAARFKTETRLTTGNEIERRFQGDGGRGQSKKIVEVRSDLFGLTSQGVKHTHLVRAVHLTLEFGELRESALHRRVRGQQ
jgi:hypothetical protein